MTLIIVFLVLILLAYFLRRRLGLAIVVAILSSLLFSWWGKDITKLILMTGVGYQESRLQAIVELFLLGVILVGFIYISNSSTKGKSGRIIESLFFSATLMAIIVANLTILVPVDSLARQVGQFMVQNNRYILTIGGIYGLYELFRTRD